MRENIYLTHFNIKNTLNSTSLIVHAISTVFLIFMSAPVNIVLILCCSVLLNEPLDSFLTLIKLIVRVLEDPSLLVMMELSSSFSELLVLLQDNFEEISDTCVVCQHHATNFVRSLYIWTLL